MSWITIIDEADAKGELKRYYDRIRKKRRAVANILKVHGLNPEALRAHFDLYLALMFGPSTLNRAQREMIAVVVSLANHCHY